MPGLADPLTLTQFADAASRGQLTPQLAGAGAAGAGGGAGGSPPVATSSAPGSGSGGSPGLPPVLAKIIGQILLSDVKSRFSTGTDPAGTKWRPLKHARPNGGDSPLRDTGILMASFSSGYDTNSVWVGTTHPGAALHNFGGTVRGKGKMLAIPLTKEAKRSGGPRRWKGGELRFQPTRKPRVFLLLGAGGGGAAAKAKKPRAKKAKGVKKKVGAVVAGLKKRIGKIRKFAKSKGRAKRRKKNGGLLQKLLGMLRKAEAKSGGKRGGKAAAGGVPKAPIGPPLVAQFLLVDQVTIPARPFMGVSEKAWGQIGDAVGEAMVRGWMPAGFGGFGTSIG